MSYESDLEIGETCTMRKLDLWKPATAMDHGPEKRLDGQKVITGRIRLMSWYAPLHFYD